MMAATHMQRGETGMAQVDGRTYQPTRSLSGLSKIAIVALLGNAIAYLIYLYLVILVAGFILPILIISLLTMLVAGLIMTGRRWMPLLGAILVLGSSVIDLSQPESIYNLSHPAGFGLFSVGVLILASALVACGAGTGAIIQNYSRTSRRVPRWFIGGLKVLSGLVLGMFIIAAIVSTNPQDSRSAYSGMTVHMGPGQFLQTVVQVPKGGKLTIVDDGQFDHVLANGSWNSNGIAIPKVEPGMVPIPELAIHGGSVEIGPFNTAGAFHIYCTIHRGMNLTVIVS